MDSMLEDKVAMSPSDSQIDSSLMHQSQNIFSIAHESMKSLYATEQDHLSVGNKHNLLFL